MDEATEPFELLELMVASILLGAAIALVVVLGGQLSLGMSPLQSVTWATVASVIGAIGVPATVYTYACRHYPRGEPA